MAVVTDNFNRANGGLGTNWTTCPAHSALSIVSNTCHASATSTFCAGLWSASTFPADHYSQAVVGTASTSSGEAVGLIVRAKTGVDEFYLGFVTNTQCQIYHRTGGSYNLKTNVAVSVASGDTIKLEAIGSSPVVVTLYKNGASATTYSMTGGEIITGGSPGILIYDTGHFLSVDDWASTDAGAVTVTVNLTGVSASPAVGVLGFNGFLPLVGVAATPVIGTGTVTIGSAPTVSVTLVGVAADPQIGVGTVEIEGAVIEPPPVTPAGGHFGVMLRQPEDKFVYLKGVSASPKVGRGTIAHETAQLYERYSAPIQRAQVPKPARMPPGMRRLFKPVEKPIPPAVFVYQVGLPKLRSSVGRGTVTAHFEDIDEELVGLLDAL